MQPKLRLAALALLLAAAAGARAETTDCTEIASVPYFINAPGRYCLRKSLSLPLAQGVAIQIQADDVTLDLNGHVLANFPGATAGWGIYGRNLQSITLRNGTIRGFAVGVNLEDLSGNSSGHLVERLALDRNIQIGLSVDGRNSVIRGNRVMRTGGAQAAYGIFAGGAGIHVADNEVTETVEAPGGEAVGITAYAASGGVVERNVVGNAAFGPTSSTGIAISGATSRVTLAGNRVANMRTGLSTPRGVASLYVDNTVGGATTPFSGGLQAGATNFSF